MFLKESLGIIHPITLTTLLSASIVYKPIFSQIISKLAMKHILLVTGKRIWINALMFL